jgi:hypothetical protein
LFEVERISHYFTIQISGKQHFDGFGGSQVIGGDIWQNSPRAGRGIGSPVGKLVHAFRASLLD